MLRREPGVPAVSGKIGSAEARLLLYIAVLGDCDADLKGSRGFRFRRSVRDRLLARGLIEHAELPHGDGARTRARLVLTPKGNEATSLIEPDKRHDK